MKYNYLENNTYAGIIFESLKSSSIEYNTLISCGFYMYPIFSLELTNFGSNSINNNTMNGKPLILLHDQIGGIIPKDTGQVILINCSNIVVENLNYSNISKGITIFNSQNITIRNTTCNSDHYGIEIFESEFIEVLNNTFKFNNIGIYLLYSSNVKIEDNTLVAEEFGENMIMIDYSESIILRNNSMTSTGVSIFGKDLKYWDTHTIDSSNLVNNKPIYYAKYQRDIQVPPGMGQVILINCSNMTVFNQNCIESYVGILLGFSNNNKISNNNFNWNNQGIVLRYSDMNIISNNKCESNEDYCITIYWSDSNQIINNTCSSKNRTGVYVSYSSSNQILNNYCTNNNIGICLSESSQNIIGQNNLSNNNIGLIIRYASITNKISNNQFISNSEFGLSLESNCRDNLIYHNNFISNGIQAEEDWGNHWSFYGEGNYWSDYKGEDNGANGGIKGDYIGDTEVPHLGLDRYPFTVPNGWELMRENVVKVPNENDTDYDTGSETSQDQNLVPDDLWPWCVIGLILIIIVLGVISVKRKKKVTKRPDNRKNRPKRSVKKSKTS